MGAPSLSACATATEASSPTSLATGRLPSFECVDECTISGTATVDHPSWGPATLYTSLEPSDCDGHGWATIVDDTGGVRWRFDLGDCLATLAPHAPPVDAIGHVFVNFTSTTDGTEHDGVAVFRPTANGIDTLGLRAGSVLDGFYPAEARDDDLDGVNEIYERGEGPDPSPRRYRWDGVRYRPTGTDSGTTTSTATTTTAVAPATTAAATPPETVAPATAAPTTAPPTAAPTTAPPTTVPPTTVPPTTVPPTTAAPAVVYVREPPRGALALGHSGPRVQALQRLLSWLGYLNGAPDALFGRGTDAALRAAQRDFGLTADGLAGPATMRVLDVRSGGMAYISYEAAAYAFEDSMNLIAPAGGWASAELPVFNPDEGVVYSFGGFSADDEVIFFDIHAIGAATGLGTLVVKVEFTNDGYRFAGVLW